MRPLKFKEIVAYRGIISVILAKFYDQFSKPSEKIFCFVFISNIKISFIFLSNSFNSCEFSMMKIIEINYLK